MSFLQQIALKHGFHGDVREIVEDKSSPARSKLIENTSEIVERGGFGVPRYVFAEVELYEHLHKQIYRLDIEPSHYMFCS